MTEPAPDESTGLETAKGRYVFTLTYTDRSHAMDGAAALRNLVDVSRLLTDAGIPHGLIFGTLLGATREGRLLPWDSDVDLFIDERHRGRLGEAVWEMRKEGLELFRAMRNVYTLTRDDERVDIYPFRRGWLYSTCDDIILPTRLLDFDGEVRLGAHVFAAPRRSEGLLAHLYGPDWRTPNPGSRAKPYGYFIPRARRFARRLKRLVRRCLGRR